MTNSHKRTRTKKQRDRFRKEAARRYKALCVARGDYKKGGRYYREYDSLVDSPRRRRYYLKSISRQSLGASQ
jgi:hypothetical protein